MKKLRHCAGSEAGFTLIEMLVAMVLMVGILAALATVTAQWLPNWNRGFAHVQRTELFGRGIERLVADLSARAIHHRQPQVRAAAVRRRRTERAFRARRSRT